MNAYALARPFLAIALLQSGPQDLPASRLLLGVCIAVYAPVSFVTYLFRFTAPVAAAAVAVELVLVVALVATTLNVARLGHRFMQTATALVGTSAVMTILAMPAYAWLSDAHEAGTAGGDHMLVAYALMGWTLAVLTHVMRSALASPVWVGLTIALGFTWVSLIVMTGLLGSLDPK